MANPNGTPNPNWVKGTVTNPMGRPKGSRNKMSSKVWEDMLFVMKGLGGRKAMLQFVKSDPAAKLAFYREYWKHVPQEISLQGDMNVNFQWIGGNAANCNGPL